jgi:hypothetical protein
MGFAAESVSLYYAKVNRGAAGRNLEICIETRGWEGVWAFYAGRPDSGPIRRRDRRMRAAGRDVGDLHRVRGWKAFGRSYGDWVRTWGLLVVVIGRRGAACRHVRHGVEVGA